MLRAAASIPATPTIAKPASLPSRRMSAPGIGVETISALPDVGGHQDAAGRDAGRRDAGGDDRERADRAGRRAATTRVHRWVRNVISESPASTSKTPVARCPACLAWVA